ncbi:MAG: hypothetical protein WD894_19545 [Pirellulales bacterium]
MQPATARTAYRNSPGFLAIIACVAIDFLMIPLGGYLRPLLSMFISDRAAGELLRYVAIGILGAQLSMLAIWLCLMAASLYWCLVALGALVVVSMLLAPSSPGVLPLSYLAEAVLTASLPLAIMHLIGLRVVPYDTAAEKKYAVSTRFTLSQLFWWTTLAAATLSLFHTASLVPRMHSLLAAMAVSAVAIATLWAMLRPGAVWLRLLLLPTTALLIAALGTQQLFRWSIAGVPLVGVVYSVTLAGLLAIYRRAGMRLVHKTAGGWLVH